MNLMRPTYSILATEALRQFVAAQYALSDFRCVFWHGAQSGGNDMYLITTPTQRYMLRVYLTDATPYDELNAQAQLCNDLAEAGILAPRVILASDGSYVQTLQAAEGVRYSILTEFVTGMSPGGDITETQSRLYGKTLGRLHEWADRQPKTYSLPMIDQTVLLQAPLEELLPHLEHLPQQTQRLRETLSFLSGRLQALPRTIPMFGLCHADAHKGNLLCAEQTLTLMDFDCAGYSWRAYELAVFRWSTGRPERFGGLAPTRAQAVWEAFLEGYQSGYPDYAIDRPLIQDFVAVRHIWWLAIDFRNVRLERSGRDWINDEVFEFQLGILEELLANP